MARLTCGCLWVHIFVPVSQSRGDWVPKNVQIDCRCQSSRARRSLARFLVRPVSKGCPAFALCRFGSFRSALQKNDVVVSESHEAVACGPHPACTLIGCKAPSLRSCTGGRRYCLCCLGVFATLAELWPLFLCSPGCSFDATFFEIMGKV